MNIGMNSLMKIIAHFYEVFSSIERKLVLVSVDRRRVIDI